MTTVRDGKEIDWSKKWEKVDYVAAFKKANKGLDPVGGPARELVRARGGIETAAGEESRQGTADRPYFQKNGAAES